MSGKTQVKEINPLSKEIEQIVEKHTQTILNRTDSNKIFETKHYRLYKDIMKRVYINAGEEELRRNYVRDMLLFMAAGVAAKTVFDTGSPYLMRMFNERHFLNWLKDSGLFNYSGFVADVKRALEKTIDLSRIDEIDVEDALGKIELSIEPFLARSHKERNGAYMTPRWLVNEALERVMDGRDAIESMMIDPFAGTGRFLTGVLLRKAQQYNREGIEEVYTRLYRLEKPYNPCNYNADIEVLNQDIRDAAAGLALTEVTGLEINPVTAALGSANTYIAYMLARGVSNYNAVLKYSPCYNYYKRLCNEIRDEWLSKGCDKRRGCKKYYESIDNGEGVDYDEIGNDCAECVELYDSMWNVEEGYCRQVEDIENQEEPDEAAYINSLPLLITPIYWGDFLAAARAEPALPIEEFNKFVKAMRNEILIEDLKEFDPRAVRLAIEALGIAIKEALDEGDFAEALDDAMEGIDELNDLGVEVLDAADIIIDALVNNDEALEALRAIHDKYGEAVPSFIYTSLLFMAFYPVFGFKLVATNPPWVIVTKIKKNNYYRHILDKLMNEYIERIAKNNRDEVIALHGKRLKASFDTSLLMHMVLMDTGPRYVVEVMPGEQTFSLSTHGSTQIIFEGYNRMKNIRPDIYIIGFDVFGTHVGTNVVVVTPKTNNNLYNVCKKNNSINVFLYNDVSMEEFYRMKRKYLSEKLSLRGVRFIRRRGDTLTGIFSGESKSRGSQIGVVYSIVDRVLRSPSGDLLSARVMLYGSSRPVDIDYRDLVENSSWLLYHSSIYPFTVVRIYKMLWMKEREDLKEFLINRFYRDLKGDDRLKMERLFRSLKIPRKPTFDTIPDGNVVVYRGKGQFVSTVLEPSDFERIFSTPINKIIFRSDISFFIVDDISAAYYYSAVLNYLSHKIKLLGLKYIWDNFARSLFAIMDAGLEWKGYRWQEDVARLARVVKERARPVVLETLGLNRDLPVYEVEDLGRDFEVHDKIRGKNVNKVYEAMLEKIPELVKLEHIIDSHVNGRKLMRALMYIAELKICKEKG